MSHSIQKALSLFLGILMFMFGFLKFFDPITGWFDVQIQQSHLPHAAILGGKLAEMTTGILFFLSWWRSREQGRENQLFPVAFLSLLAEMVVAIYVHLQPSVPERVLPLGIKSPVIPIFVLALGVVAAVAAWKNNAAGDVPHGRSAR